jgi:RNA polymerase sigma factor (sigma-70 family)
MANGQLDSLLEHVNRLAVQGVGARTDGELLEQFLDRRDETAFAALLWRHGPMVLGVCRRVLRHAHDAEDACQAAFLVLARKAAAIRKHASLGSWLHGVAFRVAMNLRRRVGRRGRREEALVDLPQADTTADVSWRELQVVLDEELRRLPEHYRAPLVLCYLEGLTRDEAAQHLGWSTGTVRGRLARGRALLRARLIRRGLPLGAALLPAALVPKASASFSAALLAPTVKAALLSGLRDPAANGVVSAQVVALAEEVLRAMFLTQVKAVAVVLLAVVCLALGGVVVYRGGGTDRPGDSQPSPQQVKAPAPAPEPAEGLKFTLTTAKKEYRVGETVDLVLTIENRTAEPFAYSQPKLQNLLGLTVTGSDGKDAERLPTGVEIEFGNAEITVPAGGKLTVKDELRAINLPKAPDGRHLRHTYYPMQVPGEYRLRFEVGKGTASELVLKMLPEELGPEVKGLRAGVTLPKEKFEVGEAIPVSYAVKNVSKDEQTLWHSGFWPNHEVIVRGADGKEPALTEAGKQRRQAFSPGGERKKNAPVKVPAGGEDAAYEKYDLTTLYDLSKPGGYTVQYFYEEKLGGWEGRLPSNEAAFEIVPAKEKKDAGLKESGAVRSNGAEFQVVVEGRVRQPAAGVTRPLDLGLRVTNTSDKALTFYNTVRFVVASPDGKALRMSGGADGIRAAAPITVESGKDSVLSGHAVLGWDLEGVKLRLSGTDDTAYFWWVDDLKPGRYLLTAEYEMEKAADATKPFWTGKVKTEAVEFEVTDGRAGLKESKAVRAAEVDFQAVVEAKVPAPAAGAQQRFDVGLGLANRGEKALLFNLFDTVRPVLKSADGKELKSTGVRKRTACPLPVLLGPAETQTVTWSARLETSEDGKSLRLSWADDTAGAWVYDGLVPGKYLLSFECENTEQDVPVLLRLRPVTLKPGQSFWLGKVTTEDVEFEIKPRP